MGQVEPGLEIIDEVDPISSHDECCECGEKLCSLEDPDGEGSVKGRTEDVLRSQSNELLFNEEE